MTLARRLARHLAERLLRHVAAVMPAHRRDWAQGMRAELAAIDEAGPALAFAAGCAWTAYQQRMSPMRIALFTARLAVAVVSLLTAAAHAFAPLNMLAIAVDLKLNGLDGWAGRFRLFKGHTADEALAAVLSFPVWHVAALLIQAAGFAAAAWFLVRWNPRGLTAAVLVGAAVHTVNTVTLQALWPTPYLIHPAIAWLDYTALALLLLATLAFWGVDRLTTRAMRPA
jgi:hypothetical protein